MANNPEVGLISAVVRQGEYQQVLDSGIAEDFFHAYPDEGKWLLGYISSYKKAPSRPAFKAQFPEFRILVVDDVGHYLAEVRKRHSEILTAGVVSKATNYLSLGNVEKAIETMHTGSIRVASVCSVMRDTNILTDWEPLYAEVVAKKAAYDETGFSGIPTGFPTFDERLGGLQPGLAILAARLGQGKSWLLLRMAVAALISEHNVHFNALEMSRAQVSYRLHAFLSREVGKEVFNNISLSQGKDVNLNAYREFLKDLRRNLRSRLNVMDSSKGRIGPLEVQAQIERNNPDVMFIDYITLMKMAGDDWSSVARLTNELTVLSNEYSIPIVCAAQLNRNAANKRDDPGAPEDLARGDSIGQDASLVIANRLTSRRTMLSKVVKNRHGEQDIKAYMHFEPTNGIFREISYESYLDLRDQDRAED